MFFLKVLDGHKSAEGTGLVTPLLELGTLDSCSISARQARPRRSTVELLLGVAPSTKPVKRTRSTLGTETSGAIASGNEHEAVVRLCDTLLTSLLFPVTFRHSPSCSALS